MAHYIGGAPQRTPGRNAPPEKPFQRQLKPWQVAAVLGSLGLLVIGAMGLMHVTQRAARTAPKEMPKVSGESLPATAATGHPTNEDPFVTETRMNELSQGHYREAAQAGKHLPAPKVDSPNPDARRDGETPEELEKRMNERNLRKGAAR